MANLENINDIKENPKKSSKEKKSKLHWFWKMLIYLFGGILTLLIALFITLNLDITKDWIAKKGLEYLNKDFKTKISAKNITIDYFGDVIINELSVKDEKNLDFIKIEKLKATSDWISLIKDAIKGTNSFNFNEFDVENADIRVITYKNDSIANFIKFVELFDDGKPRNPNKPIFQMNAKINLHNSKVSIINENSEGDAGKWLNAKNVNLSIDKLKIVGPEIDADLKNFSFITERWGKKHNVETFSGHFSLRDIYLSFSNLTFKTDHSLLKGEITFNLDEKTKWQDFNNKVVWDMFLDNGSSISGYDISYFATQWDNHTPIQLAGKMHGTLNHFDLAHFYIGNEKVHISTEGISLHRIMEGDFFIKTKASADFTYLDLKAMLPSFIAKKMKNFADDFGRIQYKGDAQITPKQILINKGSLITGIGNAEINNFILEDFSSNIPKYSGNFDVKNLNTSVITKSKEVGNISGKFQIKGQSFDINTMVLDTKSQIHSIEIAGKNLKNLHLDGKLHHRKYNGIININSPEAQANINGLIDFSTPRIFADAKADIKKLNINYFTGNKGNRLVSGVAEGKFAMTNLDDLTMDASFDNIHFINDNQHIKIPYITLNTYLQGNERNIIINSPNAINGKMVGRFNLSDLSGMIQNGIDKILVGVQPRKLYKNQYFNADFIISQNLVSYFTPDVSISDNSPVSISYNGDYNHLSASVEVEKLAYKNNKKIQEKITEISDDFPLISEEESSTAIVHNIKARINTQNIDEQIIIEVEKAEFGDNILKNFELKGRNNNNHKMHIATLFDFGSKEDEKQDNLKNYTINLNQSTDENGNYVFRFEPTHLKFHNTTWSIDENTDHHITYHRKTGGFSAENLRIYSDDSEFLLENLNFKSSEDFKIKGNVSNIQIAKLFEMQSAGNTMDFQGVANGNFSIIKNTNALEPIIDLNVENMKMGGRDMGSLIISTKNSPIPNIYDVEAKITAGILGTNKLHAAGVIDNNPQTPTIDISTHLNDFDLTFSQQFVAGIFSNLRGKANGTVRVSGPINNIDYNGEIDLSGFGLKLDFTGVDYAFEDTTIPLSKGFVSLNDIKLKDGRENSSGSISGFVRFETLQTMGVNLLIRADNLIVLNSSQKQNDLFWGRVYGQGDLYISGPVTGLDIITPNMKALNGSSFSFNSSSTTNVEEFKMLRFLQKNEEGTISLEEKKRSGANMNVDFAVSVDRGTNVNVLLGENVGNINVKGESKELRFRMSKTGNINLDGNYLVDSGTFVSKAILERTFQIAKGSSIRWDGDAMTPMLDIKANYNRTVNNLGQYLGTSSLPPVNVLLSVGITGTLNNPNITFGVNAPDVSSQIKETLATKMANEDEKIIQFGSILVLSGFNVSNAGSLDLDAKSLESSGYNLLFKQLGSVINTISNEFQIDLNYLKGDQANNTSDRASASVSIEVSPRITIKTGVGVPIAKTENTTNDYLSGEGTIEYDWSKNNDGTRLLRMYSKPSNIGLVAGAGNSNANQTYGIGAVYSKSFNHLFRKKKKKKKTPQDSITIINDSID